MKDAASNAKMRFRVEGLDCASCATKIENALRRMPGVTDVAVSVAGGTVTLGHAAAGVDGDEIRSRISNLGYRVANSEAAHGSRHDERKALPGVRPRAGDDNGAAISWWRTRKGMLVIASGVALVAAFAIGKGVPAMERWVFLVAMLVGLIPIARRAIAAARAGTPFSIEI